MNLSSITTFIGSILVLVGTFTPWYFHLKDGLEVPETAWGVLAGWAFLTLSSLVIFLTVVNLISRSYFAVILSFFFALLTVILVLINNPVQADLEVVSLNGFWFALVGALLMLLGTLWSALKDDY